LPAQYADNAQWLMRRSIEGKIRVLADSTGRYLWPLQSGSLLGLPNGTGARALMDYQVNNSDFMPDDGTDANKVTIFGDLSAYIIAQRAQISTQILRERFADTDQTGIIIFERVGGALWNADAVRVGIV
jgi:HK97 family phage major capsid protein